MASALPLQKYPNTIRTVSGTVTVRPDDVVLKCTTSSAAVTINLCTFTDNYWSTQYKLYIIDDSGMAATNNITINAPSGFTINGASSAIINTNDGSAVVRIIANTAYICNFSSFSNTPAPMPYMYATRAWQTPATTYLAVAAGGINSVASGSAQASYDSKVESNLTGMNITSGVFTVPSTGYYQFGANLTTRINSSSVDTVTNGSGAYWITNAPIDAGIGFISLAIIKAASPSPGGGNAKIITAEKQFINQQISDVNIECTSNLYPCTEGDLISVYALNKTNLAIIGIAQVSGQPDCELNFTVTKVG